MPALSFTARLALAVCCLASAGCSGNTGAPQARQILRLGTSLSVLPGVYSKLMPDFTFVVTARGNARAHLEALQAGSADVVASKADVVYLAHTGQMDPRVPAFDRLRGMMVLRPASLHLVARRNLTVHGIAGLRGLRVALGAPGTETALAANMVLASFGLSKETVRTESLRDQVAIDRLLRGDLDAVFISGSDPDNFVMQATEAGGFLMDINGDPIERLRGEYLFLRRALIPARTYAHQQKPVYTVGVDTVLLCRVDLDDALVYRLTKALVEGMPYLPPENSDLQRVDPLRLAATPIPLHSGAARYYRERELSR